MQPKYTKEQIEEMDKVYEVILKVNVEDGYNIQVVEHPILQETEKTYKLVHNRRLKKEEIGRVESVYTRKDLVGYASFQMFVKDLDKSKRNYRAEEILKRKARDVLLCQEQSVKKAMTQLEKEPTVVLT